MGIEIARRCPNSVVTIIDREDTVVAAKAAIAAAGVAGKCHAIGGDFLQSISPGEDLYVVKHVLRDWPNADAIRLLRTIRSAVRSDSHLLVIDGISGEAGVNDQLIGLVDIQLFGDMGGGLRSRAEWSTMLREGGFELFQVTGGDLADASFLLCRPSPLATDN